MKRTRATINEVKYIEAWLKNPDKSGCPFQTLILQIMVGERWCEICFGYFPALRERAYDVICWCPCSVYGIRYVTKVAKQLVKEAYEKDKSNSQGS